MDKKKVFICIGTIFSLLFITHHIAAQVVYYTASSIEIREFVAEQLKDTQTAQLNIEANAQNNPHIFTQSNGSRFLIYYHSDTNQKNSHIIRIIPHSTPTIVENSDVRYGTWDIMLDADYTLQKIVYYFHNNADYNIAFSTHRNTSSITVHIENKEHISHVITSIALMTLLRMKFDDIIQATEKYIVWHNILPRQRNFKAYERARHFAIYLQAHTNKNATGNNALQKTTINATVEQVQKQLYFDTNKMLTYIGKNKINETQFLPTYNNGMKFGIKDPTYIRRYTENIFAFLKTFPEFHTKRQHIQYHKKAYEHYTIYTRLYFYSLSNPEIFYLIASGTNIKPKHKSHQIITYDSAQIVVPYFTPSGKFDLYTYNRNASFLKHAEDISTHEGIKSFAQSTAYRRVIFFSPLRIPNKNNYIQ